MKYLRKFANEADASVVARPNVVLFADTNEVRYNYAKLGVFIQHINGELFITEQWSANGFSNDDANGVAVISEKCSFVIAKENVAGAKAWGGYGKDVINIVTTNSYDVAKDDYEGRSNTSNIIEQLAGYTDSQKVIGAPAAEACVDYIFPNGKMGYLPSFGEWSVLYDNLTDVKEALSLISGEAFGGTNRYWSSTMVSTTQSWDMLANSGDAGTFPKYNNKLIRAFTELILP